ncbi:MAG: helix-turn-helix domain-containing protein [Halobacteriota archaeon]
MKSNKSDATSDHKLHRHVNKMGAKRFALGYTQEDMARMLGVTQATYNRIENEVDRTTDERLKQIAGLLGLRKDELYDPVVAYETDKATHLLGLGSESMKAPTRKPSDKIPERAAEQEERLNPRDIPAILKELKELADAGVITEAQFEEKRKELLARL